MTTSRLPRVFRLLAVAVFAFAALALRAAEPVAFDIPAQPAPAALKQFTKQSGAQVVYIQDELASVTTQAIKGEFTPAAALARLLEGTGFTAEPTGNGNFTIVRKPAANPGSIEGSVQNESGKPVMGARVSLTGTKQAVITDKRGRFFLVEVPAGPQALAITAEGMQNTKVTDVNVKAGHRLTLSTIAIPLAGTDAVQLEDYIVSAKKNDGVVELDPYEVSGRKEKPFSTSNIDLQRSRDDILPFNSYSAEDIVLSGAANVEEFLRLRVPQIGVDSIPDEINTAGQVRGFDGANQINMRGWGSGVGQAARETVILVNGRRLPTRFAINTTDPLLFHGDVRGIPLSAIDRVEILSSAGSAIYGANATGGVINIILKNDYRGGQVSLNYEDVWDGHAPKRSAELSYRFPLTNNVSIRILASLSDSTPLTVSDRSSWMIERWQTALLARDPSRVIIWRDPADPRFAGQTPPVGATPNIRAATSTVSLFGPGTANYTSSPDGYQGGGGILPFMSRQGVWNLELSEGSLDPRRSKNAMLGARSKSTYINAGIDVKLSRQWDLTTEAQFTKTEAVNSAAYSYQSTLLRVRANAAINPFGTDILVNFDDPRMDRPETKQGTTNQSQSFVASLRGTIDSWRALLDFSYAKDQTEMFNRQFYAPIGGWVNALAMGVYNPLVDMRTTAPAAPSFYETFVLYNGGGDTSSDQYQFAAKGSGPLAPLWGGEIMLTAGIEWVEQSRKQARNRVQYINSSTGVDVPLIPGDPNRFSTADDQASTPNNKRYTASNYSAYAEATAPLIPQTAHIPLVYSLEIFASSRIELAEQKGFRTNGDPIEFSTHPWLYACGLRYEVISGLAARASVSLGFRPPILSEVTPSLPASTSVTVRDPRRSSQSVTLTPSQFVTGGNPDLKPMTTDSKNLGIVWEPRFFKRTRLSVDYIESVREDVITTLTNQQVIDMEDLLPARIQRAASDGHASGVGPIIFVDSRTINLRQMASKSVDIAAEHTFPKFLGGELELGVFATKQLSFEVQAVATAGPVEQVRNPTAAFSLAVEWSGNVNIRYKRGLWAIGWTSRYYDDILARPTEYIVQGSDRAEQALEHDAFVTIKLNPNEDARGFRKLVSGSSFSLGIKNIWDRKPRYWSLTNATGYLAQDSVMGRSVWARFQREF